MSQHVRNWCLAGLGALRRKYMREFRRVSGVDGKDAGRRRTRCGASRTRTKQAASLAVETPTYLRRGALSTLTAAVLAAHIVWPPSGGEDDWPWALGMGVRHSAQQEVDLMANRLRGDLEPDELAQDVIAVGVETTEPASAAFWIRGELDES